MIDEARLLLSCEADRVVGKQTSVGIGPRHDVALRLMNRGLLRVARAAEPHHVWFAPTRKGIDVATRMVGLLEGKP